MSEKIYILYDCIEDKVIATSFDKDEVFAKLGKDFFNGVDVSSYSIKGAYIDDLEDETGEF